MVDGVVWLFPFKVETHAKRKPANHRSRERRLLTVLALGFALSCSVVGGARAWGGNGATETVVTSDSEAGCPSGGPETYASMFHLGDNSDFPKNRFFLVARHVGQDHVLDENKDVVVEGRPLARTYSSGFDSGTGLVTGVSALAAFRSDNPTEGNPSENWNFHSAFQLGCLLGGSQTGSYINTWTFPSQGGVAFGGPHSTYSIEFDPPKDIPSPGFNSLWLQIDHAQLHYLNVWGGVGQIVLAAFLDGESVSGQKQTFQLLSLLYDSRKPASYIPKAYWDGAAKTPYATAPALNLVSGEANRYLSVPPPMFGFSEMRESVDVPIPWTAAFRVEYSVLNFNNILTDINSRCAIVRADISIEDEERENCASDFKLIGAGGKLRLKSVFLLHEVFRFDPVTSLEFGHIAMGINGGGLGAYQYSHPDSPVAAKTTIQQSSGESNWGQSVLFSATIAGLNPTGSVTFKDAGTPIIGCLAVSLTGAGNAKSANCSTNGLGAGTHSIVASYSGDGNHISSDAAISHTVTVGSPTVQIAQSVGETLSGNPYTITWNSVNATSCLMTKTLNGVVQFGPSNPWDTALAGSKTVTPAAPGQHVFTAQCTGPGGTSSPASFLHAVTCPAGTIAVGSGASTSCAPVSTASINGTSQSAPPGTTFTVSWGSTNATSCVVTKKLNGVWQFPADSPWATGTSGSKTAGPSVLGLHEYINNCTGAGGASNTATFAHWVMQ